MTSLDDAGRAIRASDVERDTVVSQLGQHFGDGRLDAAEHEQRVAAALTARTRRELTVLLHDLPADKQGPAQVLSTRRSFRPLRLAVLAAVIVTILLSGSWSHGRDGGWPFAPFAIAWLVLAVRMMGFRLRRGWRQ